MSTLVTALRRRHVSLHAASASQSSSHDPSQWKRSSRSSLRMHMQGAVVHRSSLLEQQPLQHGAARSTQTVRAERVIQLLPFQRLTLLRTLQFVPPKKLAAAMNGDADVLVLDMEDAVAYKDKAAARQTMIQVLQTIAALKAQTLVPIYLRVNCLTDPAELQLDLQQLVANPDLDSAIDGLLLPKINTADDVATYMTLVQQAAAKAGMPEVAARLGLIPIIETASAVQECAEIARAHPRNVGLVLGHVDLLNETGGSLSNPSAVTHARNKIVTACRAAGILPIDCAFTAFNDGIGFEQDCRTGKELGFAGKAVLHPSQLPTARIVYGVSSSELKWASQLIASIAAEQKGVFMEKGGKMTGPPFVALAAKILKQHQQSTELKAKRAQAPAGITTAVHPPAVSLPSTTMPTYGLDLQSLKLGGVHESLLELTVTDGMKQQWDESFFDSNRLLTSTHISRDLGFPGQLVPFSMLMTLSVAMSVIKFSENAIVYLGLTDATQHLPVYTGDSLRNFMRITGMRNTTDGKASVIRTQHSLVNQHGYTVFTAHKATMFDPIPFLQHGEEQIVEDMNALITPPPPTPALYRTILQQHITVANMATVRRVASESSLHPHSVLVHRIVKVFGGDEHRALVTTLRVTNQHHYNHLQFAPSELLIAGPLSVSATLSCAANDLGHLLHQHVHHTSNINRVNPGDAVGAVSYVVDVREVAGNPLLEEIDLYTLGVKNTDMNKLVNGDITLPAELWHNRTINNVKPRMPKAFEALMISKCPELHHRIVCQLTRTVIRVKPQVAPSS